MRGTPGEFAAVLHVALHRPEGPVEIAPLPGHVADPEFRLPQLEEVVVIPGARIVQRLSLRQCLPKRPEGRLQLAPAESHVADLLERPGPLQHFFLGALLADGREIGHCLVTDRVEQLELADPFEVLAQVAEHEADEVLRLCTADVGFPPGVLGIQSEADGE